MIEIVIIAPSLLMLAHTARIKQADNCSVIQQMAMK
jgi:hypothetical protein